MSKKANAIIIILGIIIVSYFIYSYGLNQIIKNMTNAGWYLFLIIVLWGFVYLFNTLSIKIILAPVLHKISFLNLFKISITGFAINYVTPFVSLGGVPYKISALSNFVGVETATSATISYTMIHMLAHSFFWFAGILLAIFYLGFSIEIIILHLIVLILIVGLIMFFFSRHKNGFLIAMTQFIKKIRFLKKINNWILMNEGKISEINRQIADFYLSRNKDFWKSLSVEFIGRMLTILEVYIIVNALEVKMGLIESFYITAVYTLFLNLIFFIPMELGSRESSLYFLVNELQAVSGLGIFVAIITRVREIIWIFIGMLLMKKSKINNKGG